MSVVTPTTAAAPIDHAAQAPPTPSAPLSAAADAPRGWLPIALAIAIFSALSVWASVTSAGFLEADACTHYQYARFAFSEPHYLVNVWGRPFVTGLYAVPATLAGRIGVRLTSLACALVIALVAWRIAKDQRYRWPALALIFTLAQPLLFLHSTSELTELPFAMLLALAFWAYRRRQWFVMALLVGLLPTARPEGFGFILMAATALALHRRPWWLLVLPLPLLAWSYAGWVLYGQPVYANDALAARLPPALHWLLWLRHEWPYAQQSAYASGWLLHFVVLLPVVTSPLLFPFLFVGIADSVKDRWRRLFGDHVDRCQVMIAAIPLMILGAHSLLYWLGKMASNGELRYMLAVAPFWALLTARGWEWVFERFRWRAVHAVAGVAALLPALVNLAYPVLPLRLTWDSLRAREAAQWYRQGSDGGGVAASYPRLLASNPEICFFLDISHTDGGRTREWRKETIAAAPPGTLLVWDPTYGLYNSDRNRTVTLEEIDRAGWVYDAEASDRINGAADGGPDWRVYTSPRGIIDRPRPTGRSGG